MPRITALWKTNEAKRLASLTNGELFEEFLDSRDGDGWDGDFSTVATIRLNLVEAEVRWRLAAWLAVQPENDK